MKPPIKRNPLGSTRWLSITALAISHLAGMAAESRIWTPSDGKSVQAEFLTMDRQQVVLSHVADHRRVSYHLNRLGDADRDWLADRAASRSEPLNSAQLAALVQTHEDTAGVIRLPLRVYLINGIDMNKDGVSMRMWITPKKVEKTVLPEINRIWQQAGIQWTLECVIDKPFEHFPNFTEAINSVLNSSRQAANNEERKRTLAIRELSGAGNSHPLVHNLFLFPFLGSTYQGFADMKGNTAFLGVWSNKPSQGKNPPQRCLLVEKEPMRIGSISRTAAHELGHNLGLSHPDKATQTEFHRLMGGGKQGYRLLAGEIATARKEALKRANQIKALAHE